MATFKIGLTSGSLILMPNPDGEKSLDVTFAMKIQDKESISNDRIRIITGREKQDLALGFSNKSKTDFDTLKAYCNKSQKYYIEIKNDSGITIYAGFAWLAMSKSDYDSRTDQFRRFFTIDIRQA